MNAHLYPVVMLARAATISRMLRAHVNLVGGLEVLGAGLSQLADCRGLAERLRLIRLEEV